MKPFVFFFPEKQRQFHMYSKDLSFPLEEHIFIQNLLACIKNFSTSNYFTPSITGTTERNGLSERIKFANILHSNPLLAGSII